MLMLAESPGPVIDGPPWAIAVALCAYLLVTAAIGKIQSIVSLRAIGGRDDPTVGEVRSRAVMMVLGRVWLVAGLVILELYGYSWWVMSPDGLHLGAVPLVGTLVFMAPLVAAMMLTWWMEYPYSTAVRTRLLAGRSGQTTRPWTLREHLAYNIRHSLLLIAVPVCLIVTVGDVMNLYVSPALPVGVRDYTIFGVMAATSACVFIFAPLLIVRIWRTAPLPPGPLRDQLQRLCKNMNLSVRDILIWRSGGLIANAAMMGLFGRVRYVLLTDALLENMAPQHIEAIFAHEAGHVTGKHIPYYALFAMTSILLSVLTAETVAAAMGLSEWWLQIVMLAVMAVMWGVGFGWISRRFERQSDVVGAWLAGGADADGKVTAEGAATFAWALQQVARLNGMPQRRRSWRHGSIASRVHYIYALGAHGGGRGEIDRLVRRIKVGLIIITVMVLLIVLA